MLKKYFLLLEMFEMIVLLNIFGNWDTFVSNIKILTLNGFTATLN